MNELFQISFPGLGIEEFTLNRIAFSIGKLEVRWYGIVITMGILLAFLYAIFRGKRNEGVIMDDIIDVGLWTVILGILGARLYYVLTTLDEYHYDSIIDVIAIWNGGLAIYGGIIGGCIGILIACKIKKLKWRKLFDMVGPGVMIAQALGRWGNFFNGEAYGYPITDTTHFYLFNNEIVLPGGEGTLFHTLRMGLYPRGSSYPVYFHPTFFYECVWNVVGFILINLFYKHKKYDGQVAILYFVWYGFGRMFIEGFRTDSLYIPGTSLRISQCLGLFFLTVGVLLLIGIALLRRYKPAVYASLIVGDEQAASAAQTQAAEATVTDGMAENGEEDATANEDACNEKEKTEDKTDGTAD